MVQVKWKNGGCSEAGLQLMTECAKRVEDRIFKFQEEQRLLKGDQGMPESNDPSSLPFHVPTALNDELHTSCIAVAVSHNSGMSHFPFIGYSPLGFGSSFRGLECCQVEIAKQLYNLAVLRK
jgi:hypothetical protein